MVWVSTATGLTYPQDDGPGEGFPVVVNTIDQALSLTGLSPGQRVTVRGFYAAGDGGGGLFEVQDSGAAPDGGTVFVPYEHRSGQKTDAWDHTTSQHVLSTLPSGQSVVYGSLTVEALDPGTGNTLFSVDGRHLHGHEYANSTEQKPYFTYGDGRFNDNRFRFYQYFESTNGSGWSGQLRATYRHSTSSIRLVRQGVGDILNVRWFGAKTDAEDPGFDNQPIIAHAINLANARNADSPESVTAIYLPNVNGAATTYEYFGSIEMGDGLTLRGEAGTEVVTATTTTASAQGVENGTYEVSDHTSYTVSGNATTHTYHPVRVRANATRLRVKADEALTHIRMAKDPSDADYLAPDPKYILATRPTVITSAPSIMTMGLSDLILDGNWEENHQAFTEEWATFDEKETWMRNAPGWAGFVSTNHGNKHIPQGQLITVKNAGILGYGSNGVLSNVNAKWDGDNVLFGNSVWNHLFYAANGNWKNITFTGFAWTHCVWQRGTVTNLVYEGGSAAPGWTAHRGPDLFNIRGGDGWQESDVQGHPRFTREDGTVGDLYTRIDGYFLDLRGSEINNPFNGIGFDIQVRNGVVIGDRDSKVKMLYKRNGNAPQAIYPDNQFQNADVFLTGGGEQVMGFLHVSESKYDGITYHSVHDSGTTTTLNSIASVNATSGGHSSWDNDKFRIFEGLNLKNINHYYAFNVDIGEGNDTPTELYILNSTLNNTTNTIVRTPGGSGSPGDLTSQNLDMLPIYWRDVAINVHDDNQYNLAAFLAMGYFEDVTDRRSGRTSEDSGSYTSTSSDQGKSYVVIPTDLFWEPQPVSGGPAVSVTDNAGGIVSSVSFSTADGSPLGDDKRGPYLRVELSRAIGSSETISFDWEAAIRPWPNGVTVPTAPSP